MPGEGDWESAMPEPTPIELELLADRAKGQGLLIDQLKDELEGKHPHGYVIQAETLPIKGDQEAIVFSDALHGDVVNVFSGIRKEAIWDMPGNFFAIVSKFQSGEQKAPTEHIRVQIKLSSRFFPHKASQIGVTGALSQRLGTESGSSIIIEGIYQNPESLSFEDL